MQGAEQAVAPDPDCLSVQVGPDLPDPAIPEDPVVELATPAVQVVLGRQQADLREGGQEQLAVERDAAMAGAGALDVLEPVVLGRRSRSRREGCRERRPIDVDAAGVEHRDRAPAA